MKVKQLLFAGLLLSTTGCAARGSLASGGSVVVRGVVKDETGAAIPGATVSVVPNSAAEELTSQSGPDGRYEVAGVPPGVLDLRAELPGFKVEGRRGIRARAKAVVEWSPTLQVAALNETVEVAGDVVVNGVRSSGTAQHSAVVTSEVITSLPTNGRNHMDLGTVRSAPTAAPTANTEAYAFTADSTFQEVAQHPLSTFSVDVDTASYSNVRRFLNGGALPPPDAVRIEEMVNYFPYDYAPPDRTKAFAAHIEMAPAPWNREHRLLRIGLKARDIEEAKRPAANLVFLVDVSGSMDSDNKLPLVQRSLKMLAERLDERDQVAMVVYAGAAGVVLPPTPLTRKEEVLAAVDRLRAGGSTNGGQGIEAAYALAARGFIPGGVNRVILATDGDFNVGTTDQGSLVRLIEEKAKTGVFLSVLGYGMGNYKDSTLELLADKGNGNYAYIDTEREARKALVQQMSSTLVTVAKDVKIQVELNPTRVRAYRLIGYENRRLRPEDFKDDTKDAGEVGAGHAVTALYELVPAGKKWTGPRTDALAYRRPGRLTEAAHSDELLRLKLRYKTPEGHRSEEEQWTVQDEATSLEETTADYKLAAAVAAFGMLLRDSPDARPLSATDMVELARAGRGRDEHGYRAELVGMMETARPLLDARATRRPRAAR